MRADRSMAVEHIDAPPGPMPKGMDRAKNIIHISMDYLDESALFGGLHLRDNLKSRHGCIESYGVYVQDDCE